MRAVVDSTVSSTVTATVTASGNAYTVSIDVARGTPSGSYTVSLETLMSRNSEHTTVYTDTLTLVVTAPVSTPANADDIVLDTAIVSAVISKPYLAPEPNTLYEFVVGEPVEINFGVPTDPYGNRIEPEVDLGNAASFLFVEGDSIKSFDVVATTAMIGTWKVEIKLSHTVGG